MQYILTVVLVLFMFELATQEYPGILKNMNIHVITKGDLWTLQEAIVPRPAAPISSGEQTAQHDQPASASTHAARCSASSVLSAPRV
jgi:hypothetical protein